MADRPILFSGPMVRALLTGTKTQTRRVLKGSALAAREPQWEAKKGDDGVWRLEADTPEVSGRIVPDIRIAVADRLYVRENVTRFDRGSCDQWIWYHAGRNDMSGWIGRHFPDQNPDGEWFSAEGPAGGAPYSVPSIHMPRWASRLTLTVTDVRVERLQDCSEADALAEGMTQATADTILSTDELQVYATTHILAPEARGRILYETIWDQINGPGAWEQNPWVAAYTFTVEHGNIDQLASKANG